MKQTAVQWLLEQIDDMYIHQIYSKQFEQAKEIEKQQIIDAANLQSNDYRGMPTYNKSGKQYYNETFRNE
jgi:hypothetical protein